MRLPPMNAIVVFEAAGRHESLIKAAEELCVTPGAVSRQIKRLEQEIGVDLFVRSNRKIELTESGKVYWAAMSNIIARIGSETEQLIRRKEQTELRVSCSRSFMQHWMLPRFLPFRAALADFNVTFTITRAAQALAPEFDCALRIAAEPWREGHSEKLLPAPMAAICSPDYIAANGELHSIERLPEHTLLYSTTRLEYWPDWLGPNDAAVVESARSIRVDGADVAYRAILSGLGIGLGRVCLVGDDLIAGKLVALLRERIKHDANLYLFSRPETAQRPDYIAFRNWIVDEAESYGRKLSDALPDVFQMA